jgi:flavin-dependent dehydrogenase
MRCADVLADSIKRGDLQSYEKNWRKKYEKDLKTHLMVKKYSDKASLDKIFHTIRTKEINKLIEEYGDMEHLGTLIKQCLKRPDLWPYFGKMFFHAI